MRSSHLGNQHSTEEDTDSHHRSTELDSFNHMVVGNIQRCMRQVVHRLVQVSDHKQVVGVAYISRQQVGMGLERKETTNRREVLELLPCKTCKSSRLQSSSTVTFGTSAAVRGRAPESFPTSYPAMPLPHCHLLQ